MQKGIDFIGITIVYFCHDGEGNFIMAKRSENARDEQGRWDIGGGALEYDDAIDERLRREIKEEYSTDVLNYEFLGFRDVHRINKENKKTHWVALDFKVLVDKDMVKIGEPEKFDELKWFRLGNVPGNLHSVLPLFFELYKGRL